jgi:hypothetical protein
LGKGQKQSQAHLWFVKRAVGSDFNATMTVTLSHKSLATTVQPHSASGTTAAEVAAQFMPPSSILGEQLEVSSAQLGK